MEIQRPGIQCNVVTLFSLRIFMNMEQPQLGGKKMMMAGSIVHFRLKIEKTQMSH